MQMIRSAFNRGFFPVVVSEKITFFFIVFSSSFQLIFILHNQINRLEYILPMKPPNFHFYNILTIPNVTQKSNV